MIKDNIIFVYAYEFGYQIFHSAIIRKWRDEFNEIAICSFANRDILYQDYFTGYYDLPEKSLKNWRIDRPGGLDTDTVRNYLTQFDQKSKIVFGFYHDIFRRQRKNDFENKCEYVDLPNKREIKDTDYITIWPRLNKVTHPLRNYPMLSELSELMDKDYKIRFVVFDEIPQEIEKYEVISNPSIQEQVDLLSESKVNFYTHSGATVLATLNKYRRPLFIIGHGCDMNLYESPPHDIWKRLDKYKAFGKGEMSSLKPEIIKEEFDKFYQVV